MRDEWLAAVALWESNSTNPNPYYVAADCTLSFQEIAAVFTYCRTCGVKTQADVRLELIEIEKAELASGEPSDNISATSLLTAASGIEDAQCALLQASMDTARHTYSAQVHSAGQSCST